MIDFEQSFTTIRSCDDIELILVIYYLYKHLTPPYPN
jgi:hypothetical protein